jgi:hypothetical protein
MPTTPLPDSSQLENEVLTSREQLARLEQEHADLRVELNEFDLLYNARVGPLEAQLAEAQLHIDEYQLRIELVQWRGKSLSPIQLEAEVEHRLRPSNARAATANTDIPERLYRPGNRSGNDLDLDRSIASWRAHHRLATDEAKSRQPQPAHSGCQRAYANGTWRCPLLAVGNSTAYG